jgi:hypothetical protein
VLEIAGFVLQLPSTICAGPAGSISAFKKIKYTDYKKLFEYYVHLRTNIKEAKRAGLLNVLLNTVNLGIIEQALPAREIELWRERQSRCSMDHHAEALVEFIGLRKD